MMHNNEKKYITTYYTEEGRTFMEKRGNKYTIMCLINWLVFS